MQNILYESIGKGYNSTRKADPYLTNRLLYHLNPKSDGRYLDIGCGTGNYTIALAEKGVNILGVEPSEKMLLEAKNRNRRIEWLKGSAEKIPCENDFFNGIIATLTLHHWTDLQKSFVELNRVLANNGKIVIFTSTPEQMKGYWLNHYFPKMLQSSMEQMPSILDIQTTIPHTELEITSYEKYFVQDDLQDCFLYVGKNNPLRYFDENIRKGISSFASLANLDEVHRGLLNLKKDIDNQSFLTIKSRYGNDLGDYVFVTMVKKSSK